MNVYHSSLTMFAHAPARADTAPVAAKLRSTVAQALKSCDSSLSVGKNASLKVLAAGDERSYSLSFEEERILSANASPSKRTQLALGRAAISQALQELGESPSPVLRGGNGEPLWPDGIIGSISHCWPWTVALVARADGQLAVGIDLESLEKARVVDISQVICTNQELSWVREGQDFQERLAMVFSAKEAVYKTWYPVCRRYIDFQEVDLSWLPDRQLFSVMFLGNGFPSYGGEVHCSCIEGFVFSCMVHEPASNRKQNFQY